MPVCRSCNKSIIWCRSATTGKWLPVDEAPTPDGNVVLVPGERGPKGERVAEVYRDCYSAKAHHPHARLYKAHHATCPQADSWRKGAGR